MNRSSIQSASTRLGLLLGALSLGACSLFSSVDEPAPAQTVPPSAQAGRSPTAMTSASPATAPPPSAAAPAGALPARAAAAPAVAPPAASPPPSAPQGPVPERAQQQYNAALQMMKTGRAVDAELELKQLSAAYPQFAGPQINLGLLYLRDSRLPEAEAALKAALKINPGSAVAGNELGIVERRLGKFGDAETVYQAAIESDPNYAPAHLNLGVLYDLYLAQPQKALDQFERYLAIAGENKQVSGWVIELKKRVGATASKKEPA